MDNDLQLILSTTSCKEEYRFIVVYQIWNTMQYEVLDYVDSHSIKQIVKDE